MSVDVDRAGRAVSIDGEMAVPRALVREATVVLALTEAASDVRVDVLRAGAVVPVTPTRRANDPAPPELRRWIVALPPDRGGAEPVRLRFRYRITGAASPLYAVGPSGSFASGTGTAWYPEVERADGVRLPGLGRLEIAAGRDVVIAGGLRSGGSSVEVEAPQFFDFATGPYRAVKSRNGRSRLYLLGKHPGAEAFAEKLEATVAALERQFGPLPQRRFDLVEAPSDLARAAGFDGASLDGFMLATGFYFDQPFNTAFFGHEISHQWWGGIVRRKGLSGAYLLDESLAQFGSLLAVEAVEGEAAAELYRRRGFPGYYAEYSGFGYLARSLAGIDSPLASLPAEDGFVARRVANAKGMLVWSMLADTMGRDRFTAFLRSFARSHAYERVTLDQFMDELRIAMGDKAWFIDEWFRNRGAPEFRLTWASRPGGVTIRVRQDRPSYRALVPVMVVLGDATRLDRTIEAAGPEATLDVLTAREVEAVLLDPAYRVIRWTPELRAEAEAILPYTRGDLHLNYGRNDEAQKAFASTVAELGGPDLHGLRARLERGLGDVALTTGDPRAAVLHYRNALAAAPQTPDQLPELWRSLSDAHRAAGDEAQAREAAASGVRAIRALIAEGGGASQAR